MSLRLRTDMMHTGGKGTCTSHKEIIMYHRLVIPPFLELMVIS